GHQRMASNQVASNPFDLRQWSNDPKVGHLAEALKTISPTDYSAIVPIPFFHIGSELLFVQSHSSYKGVLEAFTLSYHSGLPLTASHLSRNSISESRKAIQFFAPELLEKEIAEDITNEQPFLLLFSKTSFQPSEEELRLLTLGDLVYENNDIALYRMDQNAIWSTTASNYRSLYLSYQELYLQEGPYQYFGDGWYQFDSFDAEVQPSSPFSGGALSYQGTAPLTLLDTRMKDASFKGEMELSFWLKIEGDITHAKLNQIRFQDGEAMNPEVLLNARKSFSIYKDWVRWQYYFDADPEAPILIALEPPSIGKRVLIDELMVRPTNSSVYTLKETGWLWNNYPIQ
ncbi:MAG: hypothetical protein AAF598_20390, partial [Bacteroidota bacterium]